MASPRHIPAAAAAGSGNKENISGHGGSLPQVASSAKEKKKPAGFNLRKSIAWNPAFFTEEGVLDNSELSVLTGSELMSNGSPCSGVSGIVPPLCRSGRYDNTYLLKEVAGNSCGKSSAYHSTGNQGRRLFSSAKTPQRDERKAPAVTQNRSSARSFQKSIPRVPAGSTQKKVPNLTSSAHMSRIPKKHLSSIPMAPRSTTPVTTVYKSNKKLAPVKTEHIHRVPELLPKSKIDSAPSMEMDVVPAIHEETNSSVKSKSPQISISNFGVTSSTFAKPSALRKPSPSVGFFTQENAHMSHGNAAERNVGRLSAVNTSSVVKPPRSKQPEDPKSHLHLSKLLSTNCATATNLVSLPVTTDSNTNTSLTSEKRALSKIISTYSTKLRDANYQERPEVYHLLVGSGATTQPLSSEKNDVTGSSMPVVYSDTSRVEGRGIIKEIQPTENSLSLKTTCFSAIEAAEDSCSLKATCSSTRPTVGSKSSPSCVSSRSSDLICQSKTDSSSIAAIDLENSYVGERALAVLLSEDESCTADVDSFSCDHQNTGHATLIESMEHTLCADQMPPSGSSSDGKPTLADRNSILNDSLYGESKSTLSDGGTELEANNASVITEDPLLHVGCENNHNYKRSNCLPVKPEAAMSCAERQHVLPVELNMEDKTVFGSDKLLAEEAASHIGKDKAVDRLRTNTILRDHLKNLVPFTEEWLAVMEACGQEVLEQKSGAVQNSPADKTAPEPSPWSPVKRKAQDVGPFDCTKYSKSVRTSVTP